MDEATPIEVPTPTKPEPPAAGSVLATLAVEEQIVVRNLQNLELAARLKAHEFKAMVDNQFKQLSDDVTAKSDAFRNHLTSLAAKYKLDVEKVMFSIEHLHFTQK